MSDSEASARLRVSKGQGGISILDACRDPELFAPWFKRPATWRGWFCFLRALFGLPLDLQDLVLFNQYTGRGDVPAGGFREAWLVVGRRGGKSMILAVIAVYLAVFVSWRPFLSPGERGTIMVVAADRRQARTIFRYVTALLKVPMLASLIERETADSIDLNNSVTIEILTANFRTVRGYTLCAALVDEVAFWHSEDSANPDHEILAAIRPAQATVPGAMLLCASSPYARRGALWDAYRKHYGNADSPVLVWKAPTLIMNPTVPRAVINAALEADPASARVGVIRDSSQAVGIGQGWPNARRSRAVRFGPVCGLRSDLTRGPRSATLRLMHRSKNRSLLDHFVGAAEHSLRNSNTERLGGREVDDQLVLGRRLHGEVGGLLSFENAIDIGSRAPVPVDGIRPVGGETLQRSSRHRLRRGGRARRDDAVARV
jgi:hypothetical protein